MSKKIAVNGDITTTGARLISSNNTFLCGMNSVALLGDKIFCPACQSEGQIIEASQRMIVHGKPVAYDGCLVACQCAPNRCENNCHF